jgi:hypothetical protein
MCGRYRLSRRKEAQIRFYNDAVQELRGFNEAWRRYLAHAHEGAFYDRDDAFNIFRHVKNFMHKLSGKIGEHKTMPKYWDAE